MIHSNVMYCLTKTALKQQQQWFYKKLAYTNKQNMGHSICPLSIY